MANVSAPIKKLSYISVIFRELIHRLIGKSKKMANAATVRMVKPMLASAKPTTTSREMSSSKTLTAVFRLLGSFACTSLYAFLSSALGR